MAAPNLKTAILILVLAVASGRADTPVSLAGPTLGYLWDPVVARLRPILGIPGSSLLGASIEADVVLAHAQVSPRNDHALGVTRETGSVVLLTLTSPAASSRLLDFAPPAPNRIVFSATGSAAALVYQDRSVMVLVSGLPETPQLAAEIDLSGLPATVTAAAVTDRGDIALIAAGGLFVVQRGELPRFILPAGSVGALSFLEGSNDVVVADAGRKEVFWIRDAARPGETIVLAGERDGISAPAAVAVTRRRVLITNEGSNAIAAVSLDGGPLEWIPTPGAVSDLQPLRGEAVFRITGPSQRPIWLLDAGAGGPHIFFVPADPALPAAPPRVRRRP